MRRAIALLFLPTLLLACGPSAQTLQAASDLGARTRVLATHRAAQRTLLHIADRTHRVVLHHRAHARVASSIRVAQRAADTMSVDLVAPDGTIAVPCAAPPEAMSCVPGGPFVRGYDGDEHTCEQRFGSRRRKQPNARPQAQVWQQTVYMDTHEVTYADFEACIEAGGCDLRPEDGRWGPLYTDFSRPRQAVTGISWFQARQYCVWRGKHLPTEAEWEKAARGPEGTLNPWGDAPATCDVAVIKDPEVGRSCGVEKRGTQATGRVLEVGSRPSARYGLYDMVGNAEEWVADWYTHDYAACGDDCRGVNPRGPCNGDDDCDGFSFKIVKGGSWYWEAEHGTGYHRRPHFPENTAPKRFHHFGFRCAASPEEAGALTRGQDP